MMYVRGIRGATTASENSAKAIYDATYTLLETLVAENEIEADNVASVWITMTPDLTAAFPAAAIRRKPGWQWVPLMCAQELSISESLGKCIRILIHTNTNRTQQEIVHVYLGEAVALRPDLVRE